MDRKKQILYIFLVAGVAIAVIYALFVRFGGGWRDVDGLSPFKPSEKSGRLVVYLYFSDKTGDILVSEKRRIDVAGGKTDDSAEGADGVELAKSIIEALIDGPEKADLTRTIPSGTVCRTVYIADNKTAYVDFSSDITEKHPGGSAAERLTIYSVVNSLVMNVDTVQRVKILINGHEAETLAGHIDLRFPFSANMRMVR